MSSGGNSAPAPPDYAKLYQSGIDVLLKNNPRLLDAEQQARLQYDPQRIADQQALQAQFGSTQYQQQLDALKQLDPESAAIRADLGKRVQSDLALGTSLSPEYARELEQSVRGAQAARGNVLGSGPAAIESLVKGKAGQDLYQQRLNNAGSFLSGPTPEQQLLTVQGVQPDRSMAYVNPGAGTAGANFGATNYANLLAGQQLQQNNNPWLKAAGGAATGAAAGSAAGPYGALAGAVIGGGLGYFSSIKVKKDIKVCGRHNGLDRIEFRYKGYHTRYRGVIAEQVKELYPEAVTEKDGMLKVNYDLIGIPFEKLCRVCGTFKIITDFQRRPNCESRDGHRHTCIECVNVYKRGYYGERHRDKWQKYHYEYYRRNKAAWKESQLRRNFGITTGAYDSMRLDQNGKCKICKCFPNKKGLCVDHCHTSGKVRGLLCSNCNAGLGYFKEKTEVLIRAAAYLSANFASASDN